MIVNEAHILVALQAAASVTADDRAIIQIIHRLAEARMKGYLGYDPEQKTYTNHYYPRVMGPVGYPFNAVWDVNSAHTHARLEYTSQHATTLQLQHLPVRTISDLRVDSNGRFGTGPSAFGSGTEWTQGEDFWPEYNESELCRSGILQSAGAWPVEPGSIRITYVAGFTRNELDGNLATTSDKVDASAIPGGVLKTVMIAYHKFQANRKPSASRIGPGGAFKSERLQDYSYTLGANQERALSMLTQLPPEVASDVQEFRHWGIMRT